jgi:hypothetical protein
LPFGFDARAEDRLTGAEIAALIFGHENEGHQIESGDPSSGGAHIFLVIYDENASHWFTQSQ